MAVIANDRDKLLQAAPVRNIDPSAGKALFLTSDTPMFRVPITGTGTPTTITFIVRLLNLTGDATFTASSGLTLTGVGNSRALSFTGMTVDSGTVTATLTQDGVTYSGSVVVNKVYDGATGSQGQQGIPGPAGANGESLYTWIKYSDFVDGTNPVDFPTVNTKYIGIAVNKTTPVESTNKADYVWSLFKGDQGVAGTPGADGITYYTWIKYGTSSTGANISDSPVGATYLGLAHNKTTSVESNNPADYSWSLIKGTDGAQGPTGDKSAVAYLYKWSSVSPAAPAGTSTFTWASGINTSYTGSADGWAVAPPSNPGTPGIQLWVASKGITAAGTATTSSVTYTSGASVAAWSANGTNGSNGAPGVKSAIARAYQWGLTIPTATGSTTYTWATGLYNTAPSAGWATSVPSSPGEGFTLYEVRVSLVDSSGAATTSVDWTTGAVSGISYNGTQGPAGSNGVTTYTWIKYATSSSGAGLSDDPTGKTYIGFAFNKTTPVESNNPADYSWSLIKGTDGAPGVPGADGVTYYTWIKYSDNADGTGLYDTPTATTQYIGIAVNKPTATESTVKTDYTWSKFKGDQGVAGTNGTNGATGSSARIAYTLIDGNSMNTTPATITVTGDVTPSTGAWGSTRAWTTTPAAPSAGQAVFQSNGIYNPVAGTTIWTTPYLSSLKVGSLSAITANLGSITSGDVYSATLHGGAGYPTASYTWPNGTGGGKGFHLSEQGMRFGDYNNGAGTQYFEISPDGRVFAPGFSISAGNLAMSGSISASTITGSTITGTNISGSTITGGVLQTATSGKRVVINESGANNMTFYGDAGGGTERLVNIGPQGAWDYIAQFGTQTAGNNVLGILARSNNGSAIYGVNSAGSAIRGQGGDNTFTDVAIDGTAGRYGVRGIAGYFSGGTFIRGPSGVFGRGGYGVEGDGTTYDFYASGSGANYGPFTGSHDGLVSKEDEFEQGDILVDNFTVNRAGVSSTISKNSKSSSPNQKNCIGVFVGKSQIEEDRLPAALSVNLSKEDLYDIIAAYDRAVFNAVGEGMVNVCGEGGDIEAGDYITTSSVCGKGMKQDSGAMMNYTVAKSRETVTFDSPSQIKQIACIYVCG